MARLVAYTSLNMAEQFPTLIGLDSADENTIVARSGNVEERYYGRFAVENDIVLGALRGYELYQGGELAVSVSGFSLNADAVLNQIFNGHGLYAVSQVLAGNDQLIGSAEPDLLIGFDGRDTISGGNAVDILFGFDGHDNLQGGNSDDFLIGGLGNDALIGGPGQDWAAYVGEMTANVSLAETGFQFTGVGIDRLRSIENLLGGDANDRLSGSIGANQLDGAAGNDQLIGSAGNDTLDGDHGNDVLNGGAGRDQMDGGAGADVFVFFAARETGVGAARDVIADFESGTDKISLNRIDGDIGLGGMQDLQFTGTQARANSVWYGRSGDDLIVWGDVDGNLRADFELRLTDTSSLTTADFIL